MKSVWRALFVCSLFTPISAFAEDTTFTSDGVEMLLQAGSDDPMSAPQAQNCVCKGSCGRIGICDNKTCDYEGSNHQRVFKKTLPCSSGCSCKDSLQESGIIYILKSGCSNVLHDVTVDPPTETILNFPSCKIGEFCGYRAKCGDTGQERSVTGTCAECN